MNPASSDSFLRSRNFLGVIAGALMLILPFLGPWWVARTGTAIEIALSPFDMSVLVLGQPLTFDLLWLFLLAEKVAMWIAGAFMILASISPNSWWSKRLFRYGMMKPLWAVIGLVVLVVAGAFLMNTILPSLVSNIAGETGATIDISIPYLVGAETSTIQAGSQLTITAQTTTSLTAAFWVAVATAVVAIAARISHRKFTRQETGK